MALIANAKNTTVILFQIKASSFKQQLYFYRFRRIDSVSTDSGGYYHELFVRSRLDAYKKIPRLRRRTSVFSREAPNFHKCLKFVILTEI